MFNDRIFILNTINSMLGEEPEFKVRQYASGWYRLGVLTEEDLKVIDDYYNPQPPLEEPVLDPEIPLEEAPVGEAK